MSKRTPKYDNTLEIYQQCRLCGSTGGYRIPIIQEMITIGVNSEIGLEETELNKKIIECVAIEVKRNDLMPQLICGLCVDKVNDFYEFRKVCRETNNRIRRALGLATDEAPQPVGMVVSTGNKDDPLDCILGVAGPVWFNHTTPTVPENPPLAAPKGKGSRKKSLSNQPVAKKEPAKKEQVKKEVVKKEIVKKEVVKKDAMKKDTPKKDLPKKEALKTVKKEPLKKEPLKKEPLKKDLFKKESIRREIKKEIREIQRIKMEIKNENNKPIKKAKIRAEQKVALPLLRVKTPNKRERNRDREVAKKAKLQLNPKAIFKDSVSPGDKRPNPVTITALKAPDIKKKKWPFICAICHEGYAKIQTLREHLIQLHSPIVFEFGCAPCGEAYPNVELLNEHQRWHKISGRGYKCVRCVRMFKSCSTYNRHFVKNLCIPDYEVPDVPCTECGKTFVTQTLLTAHECPGSTSTVAPQPIKTNTCQICGRQFLKPRLLKSHEKYCQGEYLFEKEERPVRKKIGRVTFDIDEQCHIDNTDPEYFMPNRPKKPLKILPVVAKKPEKHDQEVRSSNVKIEDNIDIDYNEVRREPPKAVRKLLNPVIKLEPLDEPDMTSNYGVRVKSEPTDYDDSEAIYNEDLAQNIKQETVSDSSRLYNLKPTLKLKIKKEHGTLNSTIIEDNVNTMYNNYSNETGTDSNQTPLTITQVQSIEPALFNENSDASNIHNQGDISKSGNTENIPRTVQPSNIEGEQQNTTSEILATELLGSGDKPISDTSLLTITNVTSLNETNIFTTSSDGIPNIEKDSGDTNFSTNLEDVLMEGIESEQVPSGVDIDFYMDADLLPEVLKENENPDANIQAQSSEIDSMNSFSSLDILIKEEIITLNENSLGSCLEDKQATDGNEISSIAALFATRTEEDGDCENFDPKLVKIEPVEPSEEVLESVKENAAISEETNILGAIGIPSTNVKGAVENPKLISSEMINEISITSGEIQDSSQLVVVNEDTNAAEDVVKDPHNVEIEINLYNIKHPNIDVDMEKPNATEKIIENDRGNSENITTEEYLANIEDLNSETGEMASTENTKINMEISEENIEIENKQECRVSVEINNAASVTSDSRNTDILLENSVIENSDEPNADLNGKQTMDEFINKCDQENSESITEFERNVENVDEGNINKDATLDNFGLLPVQLQGSNDIGEPILEYLENIENVYDGAISAEENPKTAQENVENSPKSDQRSVIRDLELDQCQQNSEHMDVGLIDSVADFKTLKSDEENIDTPSNRETETLNLEDQLVNANIDGVVISMDSNNESVKGEGEHSELSDEPKVQDLNIERTENMELHENNDQNMNADEENSGNMDKEETCLVYPTVAEVENSTEINCESEKNPNEELLKNVDNEESNLENLNIDADSNIKASQEYGLYSTETCERVDNEKTHLEDPDADEFERNIVSTHESAEDVKELSENIINEETKLENQSTAEVEDSMEGHQENTQDNAEFTEIKDDAESNWADHNIDDARTNMEETHESAQYNEKNPENVDNEETNFEDSNLEENEERALIDEGNPENLCNEETYLEDQEAPKLCEEIPENADEKESDPEDNNPGYVEYEEDNSSKTEVIMKNTIFEDTVEDGRNEQPIVEGCHDSAEETDTNIKIVDEDDEAFDGAVTEGIYKADEPDKEDKQYILNVDESYIHLESLKSNDDTIDETNVENQDNIERMDESDGDFYTNQESVKFNEDAIEEPDETQQSIEDMDIDGNLESNQESPKYYEDTIDCLENEIEKCHIEENIEDHTLEVDQESDEKVPNTIERKDEVDLENDVIEQSQGKEENFVAILESKDEERANTPDEISEGNFSEPVFTTEEERFVEYNETTNQSENLSTDNFEEENATEHGNFEAAKFECEENQDYSEDVKYEDENMQSFEVNTDDRTLEGESTELIDSIEETENTEFVNEESTNLNEEDTEDELKTVITEGTEETESVALNEDDLLAGIVPDEDNIDLDLEDELLAEDSKTTGLDADCLRFNISDSSEHEVLAGQDMDLSSDSITKGVLNKNNEVDSLLLAVATSSVASLRDKSSVKVDENVDVSENILYSDNNLFRSANDISSSSFSVLNKSDVVAVDSSVENDATSIRHANILSDLNLDNISDDEFFD